MEKGESAGAVSRKHVVSHGFIVDEPSASCIDAGGGSGRQADLIGVDCGLVASMVEVSVDVY